MRNKRGLTIIERINKDIELAEAESNAEQRRLLAHMAIAAAEFAVDFGLISHRDWGYLTHKAFAVI